MFYVCNFFIKYALPAFPHLTGILFCNLLLPMPVVIFRYVFSRNQLIVTAVFHTGQCIWQLAFIVLGFKLLILFRVGQHNGSLSCSDA